MTKYDEAWRTLLSTPEMMTELLRGYVHDAFIHELDFSSLERVNGSYVAESLTRREEDMVWKIRFQDREIFIYVLLEFQSSQDDLMALRMMTYLGLFYQDLVKQQELFDEKLPSVLPVVLYTGRGRWKKAQNIAELISCPGGGLEQYTPTLRYLLIDVNQHAKDGSDETGNLMSAIFALENAPDRAHTVIAVRALRVWLQANERDEVRRTVSTWFREVFSGNRRILEIPDDPFKESDGMLEQKVVEWYEEEFQRGLHQGIEQGVQQGIEQGEIRGREEERMGIARAMKASGMDVTSIAELTGLAEEKIILL